MGTNIRPELSNKSPYWIERHRYDAYDEYENEEYFI